jgi:photosystem II stability/assembly factor-like uncharacterized protein
MNRVIIKIGLVIILVALIYNAAFAQVWEKVETNFSATDTLMENAIINFINKDCGYISSYNPSKWGMKLFKTTTGGLDWTVHLDWGNVGGYISTFKLDTNHIWFIGGGGGILFSTDKGINWDTSRITDNYLPTSGSYFSKIYFFDAKEGIAFNEYRWFSSDGGDTWVLAGDTSTFFPFPTDVYFVNGSIGWMVSNTSDAFDVGSISKTTDGGYTWQYQHKRTLPLNGVYFLDSLKGFAVGSIYLYKTTDGGTNWVSIPYYSEDQFLTIEFLDSLNGWIGGSGQIFRTSDGGENWIKVVDSLETDFNQIIILKEDKVAYAFGDDWYRSTHTLLKADLSGITSVENKEDIPTEFALRQNYPNPFNPSTTIKFSLPQRSEIKLTLYNMLGQKIDEIFNRVMEAGTYEYLYDAGGLSSGVYIYVLEAGDLRLSKKMILLK